LLVHYFGFPNALDEAQSLCNELGWRLVEDCAHSFLSKYRGTVVGTIGDASIHSYRKLLPIPDGAALRMTGATELDLSQASMGVLRQALRKVAKSMIYRVGLPPKLWERMQRLLGAPGAPVSADSVPRRMSQVSRRLMAVLGPRFDTLVEKRRHNYAFLADGMSRHHEVELLFPSLPDGVCPQVLPLLVGDQERVRVGLKAHGIPAGTWPDLPKDLPNNGVAAIGNEIASSLITLPVHQDLSENDLHHILDAYQGIRV
jgi:dTDP-4-amino-4,6-dideoxygalactose transaminase